LRIIRALSDSCLISRRKIKHLQGKSNAKQR
jgi:hypothetical protein